tara:strand:- start:2541 stop:3023 length:483 start_codon:yes stop_codon:yes gene_type:complete
MKYKKNTGKALENLISKQALTMAGRNMLSLEKVDPPTRTINTRSGKITTLLKNPFPDFIGCMPCGKMVCIEAKSNQLKNLPIGNGGLRDRQIEYLLKWRGAGAVVGIIWQAPAAFKWVTLDDVDAALRSGRKSVPIGAVRDIPSRDGLILNFMEFLKEQM